MGKGRKKQSAEERNSRKLILSIRGITEVAEGALTCGEDRNRLPGAAVASAGELESPALATSGWFARAGQID